MDFSPSLAELSLVEEDCRPPDGLGREVSGAVVLGAKDAVVLALSAVFKFGTGIRGTSRHERESGEDSGGVCTRCLLQQLAREREVLT